MFVIDQASRTVLMARTRGTVSRIVLAVSLVVRTMERVSLARGGVMAGGIVWTAQMRRTAQLLTIHSVCRLRYSSVPFYTLELSLHLSPSIALPPSLSLHLSPSIALPPSLSFSPSIYLRLSIHISPSPSITSLFFTDQISIF